MASINCPECGREISDKAPACIGCGAPMETITAVHALEKALEQKDYPRVLQLDPTNSEALKMKAEDDHYSIHTGKIVDAIIDVGDGHFAGVDIVWNIDESICEHYTQILFLIQELGYPVDLESVRFTRDELMTSYRQLVVEIKDTLIFDEDFINDFPDKINSFIKIYCSPK